MTCFGNGQQLNGGVTPNGCDPVNFWAYRNANQAITSGVEALIDWNNKLVTENPSGFMNLTTNIATIPANGTYVLSSSIEMVVAAAGSGYLRWYLNGTYRGAQTVFSSIANTIVLNFAATRYLFTDDTIEMRVFQNTGFAASLIGCCNQLFFSCSSICLADLPE